MFVNPASIQNKYSELNHMSLYELPYHYKYYGKNEGRIGSEEKITTKEKVVTTKKICYSFGEKPYQVLRSLEVQKGFQILQLKWALP